MHKAYRLVAGCKSVVCAFSLPVYVPATVPKRPNKPAPAADTGNSRAKGSVVSEPRAFQI